MKITIEFNEQAANAGSAESEIISRFTRLADIHSLEQKIAEKEKTINELRELNANQRKTITSLQSQVEEMEKKETPIPYTVGRLIEELRECTGGKVLHIGMFGVFVKGVMISVLLKDSVFLEFTTTTTHSVYISDIIGMLRKVPEWMPLCTGGHDSASIVGIEESSGRVILKTI